jgi:ubiquinone biosynthesis protein
VGKIRGALSSDAASELRDGLAELGPTFIKLGQVLSTRPDLVPPAFEAALSALQDSAPQVAIRAIRVSLVAALGSEVEVAYSSFDDTPLAAASIGQVHAALLPNGRDVVVKVRRPAIVETVELDLAILRRLARLVAALPGPLRLFDVVGFVEDFGTTIRRELDYLAEGANADRIRPQLAALGVHVPEVIWSHTRTSVLTLERIHGAKIDDLAALEAMGVDRCTVARAFVEAYLSMVFVSGFFHADPHPGNLFVEADGRVAMVDFGMVGTVSVEVRHALVEILMALSLQDVSRSARALHNLGVVPADVDEAQFSVELGRLATTTVEAELGELRFGPLLRELMTVSRHHHLRLPRELGLLVKTIVMCEGLAAQLDPNFSLFPVIGPFLTTAFQPATRSETS